MMCKLCSLRSSQPMTGRRGSGFTLVEVAVALAIFVFGALAIIRIFPPALGVIQNSESRQTATMMGRSTLASLTAGINSVPDAIFDTPPGAAPGPEPTPNDPYVNQNGQIKGIAVIGGASKNVSLPQRPAEGDYSTSALGRFKRIFGQRCVVQRRNAPGIGNPLFITTRFPYISIDSVRVHLEDTVVGVRVDSAGRLDFSDARRLSDDSAFYNSNAADPAWVSRPPQNDTGRYPNMRIDGNPPTNNPMTFYVSYRWLEGGRVQGVIDEPIRFPNDANWINDSGKVLNGGLRTTSPVAPGTVSVIPGSVQVRFRQPLTQPFGNNDPIRGYLEGLQITASGGVSAGDVVSVDYDVWDWRWIVDDGAPTESPTPTPGPAPVATPSVVPRVVRLATRNITDETLYPVFGLLMSSNSDGTTTVNLNGQWSGSAATTPMLAPPQPKEQSAMRKSGRVVYDVAGFTAPRTRTVYRSLDGWAHQLSVAARSYLPFYQGPMARPTEHPLEGWRVYTLPASGLQSYLYFRPAEAGKAVMVSYEYVEVPGNPPTYRRVTGSVFTIQDDLYDASTLPLPAGFAGESGKVSRLELTNPQGNPVSVSAILSVQGIGMTARTAWLDGDRYTQQIVNGYRPLN